MLRFASVLSSLQLVSQISTAICPITTLYLTSLLELWWFPIVNIVGYLLESLSFIIIISYS